jgi:hypothetical protein
MIIVSAPGFATTSSTHTNDITVGQFGIRDCDRIAVIMQLTKGMIRLTAEEKVKV